MIDIIAITNQKGGVGKSTCSQMISSRLSILGFKVLCLDLDPQGNLTSSVEFDDNQSLDFEYSSINIFSKDVDIKNIIVKSKLFDIVPSSPMLSGADAMFNSIGKEYILKEALQSILNSYDYIIIDTPPALGVLTVNALSCCTKVLIPAQADIYSLQGISQLHETIFTIKKYCNSNISILGLVLTRYNSRAIITRDVTSMMENIASKLNTRLFNTKIRECIAIKEAQAIKKDIFSYAPKSNASLDYINLVNEILGKDC